MKEASTIFFLAQFAHAAGNNDLLEIILQGLGELHAPTVHFPIALIIMTAVSEILYCMTSSVIYLHSSRFMIIAAALIAIPAALFGLAHGLTPETISEYVFWWHRLCGLLTASSVAIAAALKELYSRNLIAGYRLYYLFLALAVMLVSITGYLGGELPLK